MNDAKVKAKEGMRVVVFIIDEDGDMSDPIAGTITKVEPLYVEDDDGTVELLIEDYPSEISLDDGTKTEGMMCWWYPQEKDNLGSDEVADQ